MPSKKVTKSERDEAIAELRKFLKPGQTVYTILRHRSTSGMSRVIDLCIPMEDWRDEYPMLDPDQAEYNGQRDYDAKPKRRKVGLTIRSFGWLACKAMGYAFDRDRQGLKVSGCGMDMGFWVIYNLGRTLWPEGIESPDDDAARRDGGYALKHTWL